MESSKIKKIFTDFMKLVYEGVGTPSENESELSRLLDTLAYSMHLVDYKYDEKEYSDPPETDKDGILTLVKKRFPQFDKYNRSENVTTNISNTNILVGMVYDDIADITAELEEVLWRWNNNSEADALWYFEDMYGFHWEYHLRYLQLYLYERKSES